MKFWLSEEDDVKRGSGKWGWIRGKEWVFGICSKLSYGCIMYICLYYCSLGLLWCLGYCNIYIFLF